MIAPGVPCGDLPSAAMRSADLVGVAAHQFDLRVDHLVDADEVRADDVPVHVLERQVQIVVRAQLLLQHVGNLVAVLLGHARDGEFSHPAPSHDRLPATCTRAAIGGNHRSRSRADSESPAALPGAARCAGPVTSSSRTARCRCGRNGSSSSTIAGSSMGSAKQPPPDHRGEVVVTDGQRVGVAERTLRGLGGGPLAHTWQRHHRRPCLLRLSGDQPLERVGALRTADDRAGPAGVDVGAVKLPRRDAPPHVARWRHPHVGRRGARRRRPELGHQRSPCATRVHAVHPLLEHGRDQRLQHAVGAAKPQMRHPPMRRGDRRLVGANPDASSSAPSSAGSVSVNSVAPLPHASQSTVSGADFVMRAVTGPLRIRLVRQIAPSGAS